MRIFTRLICLAAIAAGLMTATAADAEAQYPAYTVSMSRWHLPSSATFRNDAGCSDKELFTNLLLDPSQPSPLLQRRFPSSRRDRLLSPTCGGGTGRLSYYAPAAPIAAPAPVTSYYAPAAPIAVPAPVTTYRIPIVPVVPVIGPSGIRRRLRRTLSDELW